MRNSFPNENKSISVYSILAVPSIYLVYAIYSFVKVFRQRKVQVHYEFRLAVIKYLIYSLLYIIFYFPSIILFLITVNKEIKEGTFVSWFSYYCSLAYISINLVLCVFRIGEGYVKCNWKAFFVHQELDESLMTEGGNEVPLDNDMVSSSHTSNKGDKAPDYKIQINNDNSKVSSKNIRSYSTKRLTAWKKISLDIMQGYIKNFFVGLILCLENSKRIKIEKVMKSKYFTEEVPFIFNNENSKIDKENHLLEEDIHIEVTEYAPRVFKKIRYNEGITEEKIMESLNPINNTTILKSQGRSSSFFISTDDSKLILKTLKKEEFDNIFNKFSLFYINYIENNPDSLICRIYGIYSVKASHNADPILIILLRDAKGPLKNVK